MVKYHSFKVFYIHIYYPCLYLVAVFHTFCLFWILLLFSYCHTNTTCMLQFWACNKPKENGSAMRNDHSCYVHSSSHCDSHPRLPASPHTAQYIGICCLVNQCCHLLLHCQSRGRKLGSNIFPLISLKHSFQSWECLLLWVS